MRLIIHATNVHQGGGKALLYPLLSALPPDEDIVVQLDSRMKLPSDISENIKIRLIYPSVLHRLFAEWWLYKNVQSDDRVICFGNLPSLFKLSGHVTVFVQNRYLIEKTRLVGFSLKTRLRLSIERVWFFFKASNADEFFVQTPSMRKSLLALSCARGKSVYIKPFVTLSSGYDRKCAPVRIQKDVSEYTFLYVASGEPHKNHRRLIEAWCMLASDELYPHLHLTIDKSMTVLCRWINQQKEQYGLNSENYGTLAYEKVQELYRQADALIYPSTSESFGLPLIEARQAGLPVLASELDYVRDVLNPEQAFDPESPLSIARAVKRFMGWNDEPLPLLNAADFMKSILGK